MNNYGRVRLAITWKMTDMDCWVSDLWEKVGFIVEKIRKLGG